MNFIRSFAAAVLLVPAAFAQQRPVVSTIDGTSALRVPTAIAIDRATDAIYVTDGNIVRVVAKGKATAFPGLGLLDPPGPRLDFGGPLDGGIFIEPAGSYCDARQLVIVSTGMNYASRATLDGTLAGIIGQPTVAGTLTAPTAVAADERHYSGKIFIADTGSGSIRVVQRQAAFCAFDDYPAIFATGFIAPRGLAFAPDGALWVSDSGNDTLSRVMPDGTVNAIVSEPLHQPTGIAVDAAGSVYIADTGNHVIRRLGTDGVLETIAGSPGVAGYADGPGADARFNAPVGLAIDNDGSLIVADTGNHVLRRIVITTPRHRAAGR